MPPCPPRAVIVLKVLRAKFLVDAISIAKVQGKPFKISELVDKFETILETRGPILESEIRIMSANARLQTPDSKMDGG